MNPDGDSSADRTSLELPYSFAWRHTWCKISPGLEHLLLGEGSADGVVLAFDEKHGPFRLTYRLRWNTAWRIQEARLQSRTQSATHTMHLYSDGHGQWTDNDGRGLADLDGCTVIDIWPTPFTNTFPILQMGPDLNERRPVQVAWILAPELTLSSQMQAYTGLDEGRYLFENLDENGSSSFRAELSVDEHGVVLDYPNLFYRI